MSKKNSSSNIVSFFSYFALIITAVLLVLSWLFSGTVRQIMSLIRDLFFALSLGISAFSFTKGKNKVWFTILVVALIIFVVFAVFNDLHLFR